ncbi:MAG: diguanylate cyclase [bacterium]|nr:GGDEF domain-containing protein [bacterium]MBU1918266.1 GGDEF domain-containing protein [bacterium]
MTKKSHIKIHLVLFFFILICFIGASVYSYYHNYIQYDEKNFSEANAQKNTLQSLEQVETQLFLYHQLVKQYLATADNSVLTYARQAKISVKDQFQRLESYNKASFPFWVEGSASPSSTVRSKLNRYLTNFQKRETRAPESYAQNIQEVFYLLQINIDQYFTRASGLVNGFTENQDASEQMVLLQEEENYVSEIYLGLHYLAGVYNNYFWNETRFESSRFHENTTYIFLLLLAGALLILAYALFLGTALYRFFYVQQGQRVTQVLLNARDEVTGLFRRESFEVFATQEIERAKRHNNPLTLLLLKFTSFKDIKKQHGPEGANRFNFQLATTLKKVCRGYDGLYQYDDDTFAILLAETDSENLYNIISRYKQNVFEQDFFIKDEKTKLKPDVTVGYAFYPKDGETVAELVGHAHHNVADIDGKTIAAKQAEKKQEEIDAEFSEQEKIYKEVEEPNKPQNAQPRERDKRTTPQTGQAHDPANPAYGINGASEEIDDDDDDIMALLRSQPAVEEEEEEGVEGPKESQYAQHSTYNESDMHDPENGAGERRATSDEPKPISKPEAHHTLDDRRQTTDAQSPVSLSLEEKANLEEFIEPEEKRRKPEPIVFDKKLLETWESIVSAEASQIAKNVPQKETTIIPRKIQTKVPVIQEEEMFEVPEVVAALMQQNIIKEQEAYQPAIEASAEYYDDFDDITNISEIKVFQSKEDDSDVIMVDFDQEKPDVAQKLRRKLKEKRKRLHFN